VDITWHGRSCFRLKGRSATVITDPVAKSSGYTLGRDEVDIISVSRVDQTSSIDPDAAEGAPMRLDAPGFYEINGVLVTAVATRRADGVRNVAFAFEIDGIRIIHLGLPDAPLSRSAMNELGEIDVLLLPVGNAGSLSAKVAADLMGEIDPPLVVPMEYATPGSTDSDLQPLDSFVKEVGVKPEPQPQLRVTRASVPSELTVAILEAR
jgi:L-ascorbate metabolism protein UlaG (beta-lactamase superfamily)